MATASGMQQFPIDVISDVVCPWCYVGKRRLEAALAAVGVAHPDLRPVVAWHPFELNPGLPAHGLDRDAYMRAKFGAALSPAHERLKSIGASVGIEFRFDAIARQPNTLDAHRLVAWAQARADAAPLVERLFAAFFVEARDVGDRAELARIAGESGLDADAAAAMLATDAFAGDVAAAQARARELGVSGVPFFVFGRRVAVSGAHEPGTLAAAIERSLAERF